MNPKVDLPAIEKLLARICNQLFVEIDSYQRSRRLSNDSTWKSIGAPNFKNALIATKHLSHELVARHREEEVSRIVVPSPTCDKPKTFSAALTDDIDPSSVLRLTARCLRFFVIHAWLPLACQFHFSVLSGAEMINIQLFRAKFYC